MEYVDFDLLVERTASGYRARVLNSPVGQASAAFDLPFSDLEVENLVLRMGQRRSGVRSGGSPQTKAARDFGGRLFESVFDDEMRDLLRGSLMATQQKGAGLRLRLRLADVPELADLPWEYLYDPTDKRFFVLSVETPLVRYLDLPHSVLPLPVKPPLRVLAMVSSPSDYPDLDTDQEWLKLQEALDGLERRGLVRLTRLKDGSLTALQRQLRRGQYHIFHFVGHGGFDESEQDGELILEDEQGRGRPVSGPELGTLLHDHRSLRLVLLNACEGARTSRSDPFAGAAQSVVQQGIPAVIAMQFEITDQAAITLSHEFYAALADGYPVDAALAEARKAMYAQSDDVEWGTPVLYLRAKDGRIFDMGPAPVSMSQVLPVLTVKAPQAAAEAEAAAVDEGTTEAPLTQDEPVQRDVSPELDSRGREPEGLQRRAEHEAAAQERQVRVADLYARAASEVESGGWLEARRLLLEVQQMEAGFRDTEGLLERVERELGRESVPAGAATQETAHDNENEGRPFWKRWQVLVAIVALVVIGGLALVLALTGSPKPADAPTPEAGDTWVRPTDQMTMVYVPAGTFLMGSDERDVDASLRACADFPQFCFRERFTPELPATRVEVDAFWIDRTEVTNAQFVRMLNEAESPTGVPLLVSGSECRIERVGETYRVDDEWADHPAACVTWYGALLYSSWVGGRLPTEAEWEYAARGPESTIYPWGNEFDPSRVNFCDRNCTYDHRDGRNDGFSTTAPVGSFPRGVSWVGAHDMAGNVWEWTQTLRAPYPYDANDGREDLDGSGDRVFRGGSWTNLASNVHAAYRYIGSQGFGPELGGANLGFRVVVPAD